MSLARIDETLKIVSVEAKDMRWPTSLGGHGSDAMVLYFDKLFFCLHILFYLNEFKWSDKQMLPEISTFSTLIQIIPVLMLLSKQMVQLKAMVWHSQMAVAMKSFKALFVHSVLWSLDVTYEMIFMDVLHNSGANWPATLNWDG